MVEEKVLSAVDTNVVLRYIMLDDPVQSPLAEALMQEGEILLLPTVMLETAWVLRSFYKLTRTEIADVLHALVALENVVVRHRKQMIWAIERFAEGADFPDVVHRVCAPPAKRFVTFDKGLPEDAASGLVPVELLA